MEKRILRCDVCGGMLEMKQNHKAVCESCGITYSLESLRDMIKGIKVSVTGSNDDVKQWKDLLKTYMGAADYSAAESVVKKILEAAPSDTYALNMYHTLQNLKQTMEIKNGILTKYTGQDAVVDVPYGVTEIGKGAFGYHREIVELRLPDTVKRIGSQAFQGCSGMTSFVIPHGVVSIPFACFCGCASLKSIVIPDSVIEICDGDMAFAGSGSGAFDRCTSLTSITISGNVKKIGSYAFNGCTSLQTIEIQNGVTSIGDNAFCGCTELKKVIIPNSMQSIGFGAFQNCSRLSSLFLPESITSVGDHAFSNCYALSRIEAPTRFESAFFETSYWQTKRNDEEKRQRRNSNCCQYCGGTFSGLFTKRCSKCGREKDY